jgi:hypothetical protein
MKLLSWVLLLAAVQARAAHGIIETADGSAHEGDIRLDANAFVITNTNGTNRIESGHFTRLKFQPPAVSAAPTGEIHGVRGTYFSRSDLTGANFVRIDPVIDFNWGLTAPFDGIGADYFSVRWEGEIEAPATGPFTFFAQADDGVKLFINANPVIDQWERTSPAELSGTFNFEAGKKYPFKMEYCERDTQAYARLYWVGPSVARSIVAAKYLFPAKITTTNVVPSTPASGLLGLYFNEPDLTGPFKTRYDSTIDYDWGEAAPFSGVNPDRFSVRWVGTLTPPLTEQYTFHTLTDDGVRLWIDNRLIIDSWREEFMNLASIPIVLQAGKRYDFKMEMFDASVRAIAKLYWSSPLIPRQIIPKSQFSPGTPPDPASQLAFQKLPAGVALVEGSVVACRINSADESSVSVGGLSGITNFSTIKTARILFVPMPADSLAALPRGRSGLLLANKDFIEGDFRGVKDGKVQIYSVLFGLKSFDPQKVIAAILRESKATPTRFEVVTKGDSRLLVPDFTIQNEAIRIQGGILSGLRIPAAELIEIKSNLKIPSQAEARILQVNGS